jgi:hypothetical protein
LVRFGFLMAVKTSVFVSWLLTSPIFTTDVSEDVRSKFLQNVNVSFQVHTALQPRRQTTTWTSWFIQVTSNSCNNWS